MTVVYNAVQKRYYGLSSDEKPTAGVQDGAGFVETDTINTFTFQAENARWLKDTRDAAREIQDALRYAHAPSRTNPFATIADGGGGGSIPDPLELGAAVFANYVAVGGTPAATGGVRLGDAFVEGDKGYVMGVAGGSDYRLIGVNSDDGWVEIDPDNFGIRIGSDQNGITPSTFVQIYNGGISAAKVGSAFFGLDPDFGLSLYGSAQLSIAGLPTADPHAAGQFWNQGFADVAALDTYLQAGGKLVSVSAG